MKLLLLITGLFLGMTAQAQTYAPYTGNKANETVVSKPDSTRNKKPKPVLAEKTPQKEKKKPKGDFQDLMNKAVEQSKEKQYSKALSFYTQALDVSTEETAWRALVSRATVYKMMNDDKKAMADLTAAIESGAPEKQLANLYMTRARALANNKDIENACKDVAKAKELGLPEALTQGVDCN